MFKTKNLYQNDERWKNTALGLQNKEKIGTWGCLLTSMTMAINGLGANETPASFNEKMKNGGGFQGAFVFPYKVPDIFPGIAFKGLDQCESSRANLAQIDAALAAGKPVIVQVDWNAQPGIQTHWVVLKEKKGKDYVMYDPYKYGGDSPSKEILLTERYKHMGKDPAVAITSIVWLDGKGAPSAPPVPATPPPPKKKVAVPKDSMTVYPAAEDLAFRAEPTVGGYLIQRFPLGTALKTLESKGHVSGKIGVMNEWLHVQSPKGEQGYIAAWYASKSATPPEDDKPETNVQTPVSVAAGGMVVTPTTEGMAFRSKPVVANDTLIKRLTITAQLKVLESEAAAKQKIGVMNQWLNVQDVTGTKGYVAAWYVTSADQPALGVRPETTNKPTDTGDVIVRTTTEGVAFRSSPTISATSLIKRLPNRSELVLSNPADGSKIGVMNAWVKAKDVSGTEGYVAAWYVEK